VLKLELALALYQRGILAMGPAWRLAGISKQEFLEEMGKRKIVRHYTAQELEEDVAFVNAMSLIFRTFIYLIVVVNVYELYPFS
jgi:predicted HTH domain antitoxin